MHCTILRFEDTPNPNAIKCITDRQLCAAPRSYNAPDPAADDPLARALFAVPGVQGVLILNDWFTVRKAPGAAWTALKPALRRAAEGRA